MKLFFIAVLLLWVTALQAEVYRWVDEEGRTHYTDTKPEQQAVETVEEKPLNTFTHQAVPESSYYQPPPRRSTSTRGKTVEMYATQSCRFCKQARQYFAVQGIAYTEYDIERDANARRRFQALGGRGVPYIRVGNMFLQGFDPARFERYYYGNTDFLQDK